MRVHADPCEDCGGPRSLRSTARCRNCHCAMMNIHRKGTQVITEIADERAEIAKRLTRSGLNAQQIAWQMNVSTRTIVRYRSRAA